MRAEVGDAEIAHHHRAQQAHNHPRHTDAAGVGQRFHVFRRHKARQNVRLPEVAQAPSGGGNDAQQRCAREQAVVLLAVGGSGSLNSSGHLVCAAHGQIHHHGGENQRENHQRGLHRIRPAHGKEAADKGVGNGCACAQPHRLHIRHIGKQALEQPRARHHTRGAVNGEEKQDDKRGA